MGSFTYPVFLRNRRERGRTAHQPSALPGWLVLTALAMCGCGDAATAAGEQARQASGAISLSGLRPTLALGDNHFCAVKADGKVWCWGANDQGQLGDGTHVTSDTARNVLSGATSVAAGYAHSCAVMGDGSAKCWGANQSGQLGNNTTQESTTPVVVLRQASPTTTLVGVRSIAAGRAHACALSGGSAYCWGDNTYGQIGNGSQGASQPVARRVSDTTQAISDLAVGSEHACLVRANGTVACWGRNQLGQLGGGTSAAYSSTPVELPAVASAIAIHAGAAHTCATLADGTVQCWGANAKGQLGRGTTSPSGPPDWLRRSDQSPFTGATATVGGEEFGCALSAGKVYCWGANDAGQLGTNSTVSTTAAGTPVSDLTDAIEIAAGGHASCVVRATGSIDCWGVVKAGSGRWTQSWVPSHWQAGDGADDKSMASPSLSVGWKHVCTVRAGLVGCWGGNEYGQLGDNTTTPHSRFAPVRELQHARAVRSGWFHTCAIRGDGLVACWGYNNSGQLGIGTQESTVLKPRVVPGLSNVKALAGGANHTCAIMADGTVSCWGLNGNGQLGRGGGGIQRSPVAVSGIRNAVAIGAGTDHTCVVLASGQVQCWGINGNCQAGPPKVSVQPQPTLIAGISDAVSVDCGELHSCALRANGRVSCWGNNQYGQLGRTYGGDACQAGDMTNTYPTVQVSVGRYQACLLTTEGNVRCWGVNWYGDLGDGTQTNSATPVDTGIRNGVLVDVGDMTACALLLDGGATCWGSNEFGAVGNGSTGGNVLRPSPVTTSGGGNYTRICSAEFATCSSGSQCCSGDCTFGFCEPLSACPMGYGAGDRCKSSSRCARSACDGNGRCTPSGAVNPDDGNPCTTDNCSSSSGITHTNRSAGTSCADGNACNGGETCDGSGRCTPGTAVSCPAPDPCHALGSCDPATGACSNPVLPDDTACNDGNRCTRTDRCRAGVCIGSDPVVCPAAPDACHDAGSCDPGTANCSAPPPKPDGAGCDDANRCTRTDTCQSGACVGSNPVICPSDPCHDPGTCSPATGICSDWTTRPDNAVCDDRNSCTTGETCQSGTCLGGTPVTCAPPDQCHEAATCSPTAGCEYPAKPDGTTCDDGNVCTHQERCLGGVCSPADPAPDGCCGDGLRKAGEECDRGPGNGNRSVCTASCQTADLTALDQDPASRTLAGGRHPVATGPDGSVGLVFVQDSGSSTRVGFTGVSARGQASDQIVWVDSDTRPTTSSDPVIVALAAGKWLVAFAALATRDGDESDVWARLVDSPGLATGPVVRVNQTALGEQSRADAVTAADGAQVVIAWTDYSNPATSPDLRYQIVNPELGKVGGERKLSATPDSEDAVALTAFGNSWAAAWRTATASDGLETVHVATGGMEWTIGPPMLGGPPHDRPAIVELDATHLLIAFVEAYADQLGTNNAFKLRLAVIDTSVSSDAGTGTNYVTSDELVPRDPGTSTPLSLDHPGLVRIGARVYVAWRSEAALGDPNGEELWLKELGWDGASLDLGRAEIPVPRWPADRARDQRHPAMAALTDALVVAWETPLRPATGGGSWSVMLEAPSVPLWRAP